MELEGIEAKAESARAPCASYWLIVFACLMIHLFPVLQTPDGHGYHNADSRAVSLVSDNWVPPSGADEVLIFPQLAAVIPGRGHATLVVDWSQQAPVETESPYEPRGPPRAALQLSIL